jgi:hypothetical protein
MTDSNAAGFSSLSATDLQELAVLLRKLIMEPSRIGEAENVTISSQAATRRREFSHPGFFDARSTH